MKNLKTLMLLLVGMLICYAPLNAAPFLQDPSQDFVEYKGKVLNSENEDVIMNAHLSVNQTNISTVTNSEGKFSLKVPKGTSPATVNISYLGYQSKNLLLSYFKPQGTIIYLDPVVEELSEVKVYEAGDARRLVRTMLDNRGDNYIDDPTEMTAFYRETISKGNRNVSLSEAVVKIHKKPYSHFGEEDIELIKARKTADYDRLDTLALKLRGGPFNTLFIDVMKYPEYLFYDYDLDNYNFNFEEPTQIDNRHLYVVSFEDNNKEMPWFFGTLFIDAETQSLVRAKLNMNVDNRRAATNMFVNKKPGGTKVYPIEVMYDIDYHQQDGKWYFGYSNARLLFVVNWKKKLFNSRYQVDSEMAVTNWQPQTEDRIKKGENFLNKRVVMADDISGFTDLQFWGSNNIIEPDKSIQNAIEKIQRSIQ
ncbi:carboxypeptidase-like regulatory domain-containing protein [Salegentibacter sp. JZCK2]|uniref:carboxypeptidase-like regulatory domain-containing protein n=1 Tax=Salegentibacter tibetensis TaxID=2873600 RepID=UPI001CCB2A52|nr:carboxypeptidase-like regulatory domain-containing protein [Salegentibacter tibetensis]MBZ9731378.1 carboxypeptidase-like regulatory domain-containing protein [Salegentibacter tibetensis]